MQSDVTHKRHTRGVHLQPRHSLSVAHCLTLAESPSALTFTPHVPGRCVRWESSSSSIPASLLCSSPSSFSPSKSPTVKKLSPHCSSVSFLTLWSLMHFLALTISHSKQDLIGASLVVQWFRLRTPAVGPGFDPCSGS